MIRHIVNKILMILKNSEVLTILFNEVFRFDFLWKNYTDIEKMIGGKIYYGEIDETSFWWNWEYFIVIGLKTTKKTHFQLMKSTNCFFLHKIKFYANKTTAKCKNNTLWNFDFWRSRRHNTARLNIFNRCLPVVK